MANGIASGAGGWIRVLGCAVLLGIALPAAGRAQYGTNLIVNPGAEAALGSSEGDVVPVPGWTAVGNFTAVQYGAGGGFPSASSPGPASRGANFFAGGPSNDVASGFQVINLNVFGIGAAIDAGTVGYDLSGYFGGFEGQGDNATLLAEFLDGGGRVLGVTGLGGITASARANQTGLLFAQTSGRVMSGARSVRMTLQMVRLDGAYNDGYADNLAFVLTGAPVTTAPEPATIALVGAGSLGVAGATRRRRA